MFAPVDSKLHPKVLVVSYISLATGFNGLNGRGCDSGWCWSCRTGLGSLAVTKWRAGEDCRQSTQTPRRSTRVGNPGVWTSHHTRSLPFRMCSIQLCLGFSLVQWSCIRPLVSWTTSSENTFLFPRSEPVNLGLALAKSSLFSTLHPTYLQLLIVHT